MPCTALPDLTTAVAAVAALPVPAGLGAGPVLEDQCRTIAAAMVVLRRGLAVRMAAARTHPPADPVGDAARAGLPKPQAHRLQALGRFAADHPDLQQAWEDGTLHEDHVQALKDAAAKLRTPALRDRLVEVMLPLLPGLTAADARKATAYARDQLQPGDPDLDEQSEHAARTLGWSPGIGGGLNIHGHLPDTEAHAFTTAINALVADLRVEGDGLTPGQRRADALAALIARATLPTAGGLPPTLTLTVSLTEAMRIAARDPNTHGTHYQARPRSGATTGRTHPKPAGDAAIRFGLCCAAITPTLHATGTTGTGTGTGSGGAPGSALARIAATKILPLAVGRAVRLATPAMREALRLRDGGGCAIPGCAVPDPHTQPHHVTPWSLEGPTDLDNLVSLCFVHHRQTELGRYTFIRKHPDQPKPHGALDHPLWWITPPQPGHTD